MKGLQRASLAAVAVALSLGWSPQVQRDRAPSPTEAGTAAIEGRVVINVNNTPQPVRRARITLESEALPSARTTDSDTDGRYLFAGLPEGAYRVRAEKPGFVPFVRDVRRAFERPAPIQVAAARTTPHDLWMVPGAAIEGQVLIDNGRPAVNVIVSASRLAYDERGRRTVAVGAARSDDRGRFRVHSLPAGDYYLEAAADPVEVLSQIQVPGRRPTALSRSYFPGAPQIEGGRTITLAVGQNQDGITFPLSASPAVVVSGRIIDSTGKAGTMTTVGPRVQRVGGPVGEVRGGVMPEGGAFRYPSVPAGDYWLMGVARPSPTADLEYTVTRLTIGGDDVTNVVLTTAKGAIVMGRLDVEGAVLPASAALQVVAQATEFEPPTIPLGSPDDGSTVDVAPDGTFSFTSLFGPRLLRVARLPGGWALKSVVLEGNEIVDSPFDFRGGSRPLNLRMVVTSRTNRVSGVARDAAGQPLRNARVVAFGVDERTWGFRSRLIRATESDAEGRYMIDGLLDGAYHLAGVAYLEQGSWMDASVLRRLLPAPQVVVKDGEVVTRDLVVK